MEAFNWGYDAKYDPLAVDPNRPNKNLWPKDLPGFKEAMHAYHSQMLVLARRMTRTFALALNMPEDYFDNYVRCPEASQRIVHYPVQEVRSSSSPPDLLFCPPW